MEVTFFIGGMQCTKVPLICPLEIYLFELANNMQPKAEIKMLKHNYLNWSRLQATFELAGEHSNS